MTDHIKPIARLMDRLREDQARPQYRNAEEMMRAGREAMAPLADLRNGGNLPKRRGVSLAFPVGVLLGMALFAWAAYADPMGRTVDAIVNPHVEGWK